MGKIDSVIFATASAYMLPPALGLAGTVARRAHRLGDLRDGVSVYVAPDLAGTVVRPDLLRYPLAPVRPQRPVMTLALNELVMRPDLRDAPVDEDDDRRVFGDRVVPMCREQDDLGLVHLREELEDRTLSLGIQACHRLIQDHHGVVLIDEARQGQ